MTTKGRTPSRSARADELIGQGRYQDALALLDEGRWRSSTRQRQLRGLALRRLGRLDEACSVLETLYRKGKRDAETMGMFAATFMDRYDRTGELRYLKRSRDLYKEEFDVSENTYTGINAAAKSLLLGETKLARTSARRVIKLVKKNLGPLEADVKAGKKGATGARYWALATEAEAYLILGDVSDAADKYGLAVDSAPKDQGSHGTTWLQAQRLMNAMRTPRADSDRVWRAFRHLTDAPPRRDILNPPFRRLRVYAFDPSFTVVDTAAINELTLPVEWEKEDEEGQSTLAEGPRGEYLEVIDYDPATDTFYDPVDLDDPRLLATDGLAPSEGNPQFHQQMVYAVGMNVISNFESALGRRALWSSRKFRNARGKVIDERYVGRLRIYPHALREPNAYYSPQKKALLFGYFPSEADDPEMTPGGTVFTCLSHDVIAHEMSHALLDGIHPRFAEATNVDVLAFHEAFADIVALFQHFSHPEVLEHEIGRTRGNLMSGSVLGQLAHQFGRAIGQRGALRNAIGKKPDPKELSGAREPHLRGSILVAAVFDAFLTIYRVRIADLLRIATQGSGILEPGAIHPDLVRRLAGEAARTARHFLQICIRALDYCPPVDLTFGDYLRAIITADVDLMPNDPLRYRLAIIEAFQRRGIYPGDVRNLSVESLVWRPPRGNGIDLTSLFQGRAEDSELAESGSKESVLSPEWRPNPDRRALWEGMRENAIAVHNWFHKTCSPEVANELGLTLSADAPASFYFKKGRPTLEVHSVRVARRVSPTGEHLTNLIVEVLQRRHGYADRAQQEEVDSERGQPDTVPESNFTFRGGATLLIDPASCEVRYAITKHILSGGRIRRQRRFVTDRDQGLRATYFSDPARPPKEHPGREPFALLHRPLEDTEVLP